MKLPPDRRDACPTTGAAILRQTLTLTCAVVAGLAGIQTGVHAQGFGGGQGGGGGNNNRTAASRTATTYPSSTQMGTATYTVNPETREVFAITDDETAKAIENVLESLNRPTPQVLIKCVFLEATYTKDSDVGVNGIYNHSIGGSGISELNGNSVVTTPASAFQAASGAATYGFTSLGGDLNITLSALAKAGKTEILSRPSILARNNQPATISLGQQVPLITNTRFDNFGNQINSVSYQNVGINLSVTPFITTDDLVEMVVKPETSELADRSQWVPISGGSTNNGSVVSVPVINSRSADTVVIVPNGQTVVIGGLMQSKKLDSTSKVPLLGDIPLLGALFRHKIKSNGKTELMIFMTPYIVRRPSDLAGLTSEERSKQTIVPQAFTEKDLNRYLDNLPPADNPKAKKKKK